MDIQKSSNKLLGAGLLAAISASLCCITPVLAFLAGSSGLAASFSWMEPFRPYLIGVTVLVIGFAWYQKMKPRTAEEIACDCEEDGKPPFIQSKTFLGIVTVFAGLMLAFPYYSNAFYPTNNKAAVVIQTGEPQKVVFSVTGMTCTGCEGHVAHALNEVDGVLSAEASYEEGKAIVIFDPEKTELAVLEAAINSTGYKVSGIAEGPIAATNFSPVTEIILPVVGMTCTGCEGHVNHAVSELPGIEEVKASYKDGQAVVRFDPKQVDEKQIVEAINKTGYTVKKND